MSSGVQHLARVNNIRRRSPLLPTQEDTARQKKLASALRILQATRGTIDSALEAHGAELEGKGSALDAVSSCAARLENFQRKARQPFTSTVSLPNVRVLTLDSDDLASEAADIRVCALCRLRRLASLTA